MRCASYTHLLSSSERERLGITGIWKKDQKNLKTNYLVLSHWIHLAESGFLTSTDQNGSNGGADGTRTRDLSRDRRAF